MSEKDIPEFYTDHGPLGNSIKKSLSEIGSGFKPSYRQQKKSLTQDNFFFLHGKAIYRKAFIVEIFEPTGSWLNKGKIHNHSIDP